MGQVALVTGASRGIGAATAVALGMAGAHVVLTARGSSGLEAVEERIHAAGGSATIAPLDLTETDAVVRLAQAMQSRWPALDLLILNAAMLGQLTAVPAIDPKQFAQLLTLNVSAPAALLAAFDPMLRASARARVVAITSSVARQPRAYWGAYGASKAALENLVLSYGDEVEAVSRIRVAVLDPGATRTAMRAHAFPGEDPDTVKPPEDVGDRIATLVAEDWPTGYFERVATP